MDTFDYEPTKNMIDNKILHTDISIFRFHVSMYFVLTVPWSMKIFVPGEY